MLALGVSFCCATASGLVERTMCQAGLVHRAFRRYFSSLFVLVPGDSFSMNFLVVLGFDLLFVNLDVFFVKSPKTTKTSIFL